MRRHGSPDARVGVEWVEVTDDGAPLERTAEPEPDGAAAHPARRRVLRGLGIAVIAALAVAAVVLNVADARRDAARREAFAALGWVMPAMDTPPEEAWRAPGGSVLTQTDGMVVTESHGLDLTLTAIETATGRVRWERQSRNEQCWAVLDGTTQAPIAGSAVDLPAMLMCIPLDAPGSDGTPPAEGASIPVEFVDLDTGEVQGQVIVDGQLLGHVDVDGDMLLISTRAERAVGVVRVDPRSGRVAWTWTSSPGVLPRQSAADCTWHLDEAGDVLQLDGTRSVAVSVADGAGAEPGASPAPGDRVVQVELASGQVVAASRDFATGAERISVLDPDGTTRFEADGSLWWTWLDDGSVPDSVVVQQEGTAGAGADGVSLTSFDVDTGQQRWSVSGDPTRPVFLLEGTVIVAAESSVAALDAETGSWLWLHPAVTDLAFDAMTDGDVVLVPVADGGSALAALSLGTGEERWRLDIPTNAVGVHVALDGTLLVITPSELIAYR